MRKRVSGRTPGPLRRRPRHCFQINAISGQHPRDGPLAATRGRDETQTWALHRVQQLAQAADQANDPIEADRLRSMEAALGAFALWKRGDPNGALPLLERTLPRAFGFGWWLGDLYLELGRVRAAARVFDNAILLGHEAAYARYRLGQIRDRLGESDAAAAYRYALDAWAAADPEWQPRVEEIRDRLDGF